MSLQRRFRVAPDAEITLEGNPREFDEAYLQEVQRVGITRISLGYQSKHTHVLSVALNSPHTAVEALRSVNAALAAGFASVNVDLLYRVPGQSFEDWRDDVETIVSLDPGSITAFEYVVHPNSPTARLLATSRLPEPSTSQEAASWREWTHGRLSEAGYLPQRRSGFAKPGHEQRYGRLAYVLGQDVVGLGAGAYGWLHRRHYRLESEPSSYALKSAGGLVRSISELSRPASRRDLMVRHVVFELSGGSLESDRFEARFRSSLHVEMAEELRVLRGEGLLRDTPLAIVATQLGRSAPARIERVFTRGVT